MSTPTNLNTLTEAAKCFPCLSEAQARALIVYLLDQISQGSGGGGGGGGAVTIADGADVAEGATSDARAGTPDQANATAISLLRAIFQQTLGSVTDLDGILTNTSALVAGITVAGGNVGGYTTVIKSASVVTAAAYSAGNAVGAKRTLSNAVRTPGTGILESIVLLDRANQKAAMTLFIFDADPTAATITDKTAFVFSTDDLKVIAQVNIGAGDYVTTNGKAIAVVSGLNIALKAASGTTLYAALVTTGTPTFAATTDVQLSFGILQD